MVDAVVTDPYLVHVILSVPREFTMFNFIIFLSPVTADEGRKGGEVTKFRGPVGRGTLAMVEQTSAKRTLS